SLPAMPEIVLKIQRIIDSPNCSIDALGKLIAREPMITAKLMRVASSPIAGAFTPPRGVNDALIRIGLRETKNVILAILCKAKLFRAPGFGAEAADLHRHALATSVAAQIVAKPIGVDRDEAFLAGIIHDFGEVVLLNAASEVVRASRGQSKVSSGMLEKV